MAKTKTGLKGSTASVTIDQNGQPARMGPDVRLDTFSGQITACEIVFNDTRNGPITPQVGGQMNKAVATAHKTSVAKIELQMKAKVEEGTIRAQVKELCSPLQLSLRTGGRPARHIHPSRKKRSPSRRNISIRPWGCVISPKVCKM